MRSATSAVRFYTPVAFALSLLILVLRYPASLFRRSRSGKTVRSSTFKGLDGLSSLGSGFRALAPRARMVAIVAAAIPPALAPLLMNTVTILVTAGVATFIAGDRLRSACPDRRLRLALGHRVRADAGPAGSSWRLGTWVDLAFFLLIRVLADGPDRIGSGPIAQRSPSRP